MNLNDRIKSFAKLGKVLLSPPDSFNILIKDACYYNGWFTEDNVRLAVRAIAENLSEDKLNTWMSSYNHQIKKTQIEKRVGVIMAGNLPLVGFHDFLCVLMSGNKFYGKLSSQDNKLLPAIASELIKINPEFSAYIQSTEERMSGFDAIIATGSNNTSRYFEYYFGKYPHIIRKNRNSVAVLNGHESPADLKNLSKDIFLYFGLGCRNVSKIFIPDKYDFNLLFNAFEQFTEIKNHSKYFNNYEYQKAIYLVNNITHLDNGFVLLKESTEIPTPVGVLHYAYYSDIQTVIQQIHQEKDKIQCVVGNRKLFETAIPFGQAQYPELNDYADGIDTMDFLLKIK